jgi:CheY-like chemotaxis protein
MPSEPPFGLLTADRRRPRVAVVDGNIASAIVTAMLVEQFGCLALSAASGEAMLALLRQGDPIDLVVIDLTLPDMDAFVAAQLIRALGARGEMPIVALVGEQAALANARGRAAGFAASLQKPYSPRELHAALQSALSRGAASAAASSDV